MSNCLLEIQIKPQNSHKISRETKPDKVSKMFRFFGFHIFRHWEYLIKIFSRSTSWSTFTLSIKSRKYCILEHLQIYIKKNSNLASWGLKRWVCFIFKSDIAVLRTMKCFPNAAFFFKSDISGCRKCQSAWRLL